ncbi:MAG: hypothetical protein AAFX93_11075 [Verrucomicrobiota bacterium]
MPGLGPFVRGDHDTHQTIRSIQMISTAYHFGRQQLGTKRFLARGPESHIEERRGASAMNHSSFLLVAVTPLGGSLALPGLPSTDFCAQLVSTRPASQDATGRDQERFQNDFITEGLLPRLIQLFAPPLRVAGVAEDGKAPQ